MCDHNHCIECGDAITETDPPAPRCGDHQSHERCAHVVHCRECGRVLDLAAQDHADDRAHDMAREAAELEDAAEPDDDPTAYDLPMTGATYLRHGERRNLA